MQPISAIGIPIDIVSIKSIDPITHNTIRIFTDKPRHYTFIPGQATQLSINKNGWKDKTRPFTFTSLPDRNYLEFIIKTYPEHQGVTNQLRKLVKDDELIMHGVFGNIHYRGEGIFIAGGAGITPFLSILRTLEGRRQIKNNKLIFANRTKNDILLEKELEKILDINYLNILSDEVLDGYAHGYVTDEIIRSLGIEPETLFYVCGPPAMMKSVLTTLTAMGIESNRIVQEAF